MSENGVRDFESESPPCRQINRRLPLSFVMQPFYSCAPCSADKLLENTGSDRVLENPDSEQQCGTRRKIPHLEQIVDSQYSS